MAFASIGGASSATPDQLIAWRALAGVAAAVVYPVTLSILTNVFTERSERVMAIGVWGAATGVAVAVGPVAGGALIEHFWWGSTIGFNVAIAARRVHVVVATSSRLLYSSSGVSHPRVFLGRLFSRAATSSSRSGPCTDKSVPFLKY